MRSRIDWFDVTADASFDGADVDLPAILRAIRDGQGFVQLGDTPLPVMSAPSR